MPTILDTLNKGTVWLEKHGIEEARLNMQYLAAKVLDCDRMQLYVDFDRPLGDAELDELRELTKRRAAREPLQHLVGNAEFCDREFLCDSRALIPRPETEEMVEILAKMDWPDGLEILDLGCGSGVIGLSLAHLLEEKNPTVTLADVSAEALSLAQENLKQLELENADSIQFFESDLFSALHDSQFDLIAANLPYVPEADRGTLAPEVLQDPELALFGGPDGTDVFARFFADINSHLKPGGKIALEFGIGQGAALVNMAESSGLTEVELKSDLSRTERFLFATKSA